MKSAVFPDPLCYIGPFRPAPFVINPEKNYRTHRIELEFIDELIIRAVVDERKKNTPKGKDPDRGLQHFISYVRTEFRAGFLRAHLGTTAVRELEIKLADSPLYQWFCVIDNFGGVKPPSKSTIDRYKNLFPDRVLEQAFQDFLRQAAEEPEHLAHNLRVLARKRRREQAEREARRAKNRRARRKAPKKTLLGTGSIYLPE